MKQNELLSFGKSLLDHFYMAFAETDLVQKSRDNAIYRMSRNSEYTIPAPIKIRHKHAE